MAVSKSKKYGIAGVALCGAAMLGMAFGPGIASAQVAEDETAEETKKSRRSHRRQARLAAFEELGLDKEVVREGVKAGKTLAEVAAEEGVDQDALVASLVGAIMEKAEESGRELEKTEAEITEKVTEKVTTAKSERTHKFGSFGDSEDREAVKAAIEAGDVDAAKAIISENIDDALEAGDIDAERAEALKERLAERDFSGKSPRRGSSRGVEDASLTA